MARRVWTVLFAAVLLPAAAIAQPAAEQVTIRIEQVADGVYALFGRGGNMGLSIGADGVFLIDDEYAPLTPAINAAIARLDPRPVKFVLNTHWHPDHTGGNANYAAVGAVLISQDRVRERLATPQDMPFLGRKEPAAPPAALPVLTFDHALTLHFNGDEIVATHEPHAHTDGDAVVVFHKADVIHAGDVFWNGMYPFIDVDSGGSLDGELAAVDRILADCDDRTRIIPGHGPLGTKADLESFRRMLADTIKRVRTLRTEGKTVDEVIATAPNADYDKAFATKWMSGERYIRMLYRAMDLEGKK